MSGRRCQLSGRAIQDALRGSGPSNGCLSIAVSAQGLCSSYSNSCCSSSGSSSGCASTMSAFRFRRSCYSLPERCGRCDACHMAYAAVEQERIEQRQLPGLHSCYGEQFRCGACLSCLRSHKAVQDAEARSNKALQDAAAAPVSAGHEDLPEVTPLLAPEQAVQAMATEGARPLPAPEEDVQAMVTEATAKRLLQEQRKIEAARERLRLGWQWIQKDTEAKEWARQRMENKKAQEPKTAQEQSKLLQGALAKAEAAGVVPEIASVGVDEPPHKRQRPAGSGSQRASQHDGF